MQISWIFASDKEEVMLLRLKICTGKILPLPTTQAHIIIKIKKKKERHNGESF